MDNLTLKAGQKLTLFGISESLAHTTKSEVTVVSLQTPEWKGRNCRLGTYKQRGKRKLYYLDINHNALVFDGWDLPFKTDSEIPSSSIAFEGNACFNLAGDPEVIKDYIENRLLTGAPHDDVKAKIIIVETDERGHRAGRDTTSLLYPEVETGHAVVNRLKYA